MNRKHLVLRVAVAACVCLLVALGGGKMLPCLVPVLLAHCDTMSGPVIKDAQLALETANVNVVLKWVVPEDEAEIREAFAKTLGVRKLSEQARELSDMYLFETLVRVHRAAEGAPYTGIKPAGSEVEPGIEAADRAVESGSVDGLAEEVSGQVAEEISHRFREVMEKKAHMGESVEAGREYVHAYVSFIHYIEGLHLAITGESGESHGLSPAGGHAH